MIVERQENSLTRMETTTPSTAWPANGTATGQPPTSSTPATGFSVSSLQNLQPGPTSRWQIGMRSQLTSTAMWAMCACEASSSRMTLSRKMSVISARMAASRAPHAASSMFQRVRINGQIVLKVEYFPKWGITITHFRYLGLVDNEITFCIL